MTHFYKITKHKSWLCICRIVHFWNQVDIAHWNQWHYQIGGEHAIDKMPVPNPSGVPLFVGVLLFHIWSILLSKPDIHHSNCSWLKLILVLNIGLWLTLVMVSVSKDAYCWWINSWTANMVNQHWPLMKPHSQPSSGNDGRPNKQDDQQHLLIGKLCELHAFCEIRCVPGLDELLWFAWIASSCTDALWPL